MRTGIFYLLLFLVDLFLSSAGFAGSGDGESIRQELEQVLKRQDALEKENSILQEKVEHLREKLNRLEAKRKQNPKPGKTVPPRTSPQQMPYDTADRPARAGLHPGGGGFYIQGEDYKLRFLGYVQAVGSLFDKSLNRSDGQGDFSVRRARFDFIAQLYENYTLFFEFDAGTGTVASTDSDFAMVEGGIRAKIYPDFLQLAAGKFITPFSTENFRSSRSLDTIERYMALNSMFLLPALDSQFGVMLFGKWGPDRKLGYYLGVFNGNGSATSNFSDDNNSKEVQAKFQYHDKNRLRWSISADYSNEESQTLSVVDLGFNRYVSVGIQGERRGVSADASVKSGRWSLDAEGIGFWFDSPPDSTVGLYGGYIQPAVFVSGSGKDGVQLLVRGEVSHLDALTGANGDTLWAVTPGVNWFVNPNVRLQVNGTMHYFDGPSAIQGFDGTRWVPMLQAELQIKY